MHVQTIAWPIGKWFRHETRSEAMFACYRLNDGFEQHCVIGNLHGVFTMTQIDLKLTNAALADGSISCN